MLEILTIIFFSIIVGQGFAQNNISDTTYQILNSDLSLNNYTVNSLIDNRLVTQKTFKYNTLHQLIQTSNDTISLTHFDYKSKTITLKEFFYIPKDSLAEFVGFYDDFYWDKFRFLEEWFDEKGRIWHRRFFEKELRYHDNIFELEYVPKYSEFYKRGKLEHCEEWVKTSESSWTGVVVRCK